MARFPNLLNGRLFAVSNYNRRADPSDRRIANSLNDPLPAFPNGRMANTPNHRIANSLNDQLFSLSNGRNTDPPKGGSADFLNDPLTTLPHR